MKIRSRELLKESGPLRMYIYPLIKRDHMEILNNNHWAKFRRDLEWMKIFKSTYKKIPVHQLVTYLAWKTDWKESWGSGN